MAQNWQTNFVLGVAVSLAALGVARAETVELSSGDMVMSAPSNVNCNTPPDFTLSGAGDKLFAGDREALNALVAQMAGGLAGSCEDLASITVRGEERGITYSFEVTREDGWRLDKAPEPAATPAAMAVPGSQTPEAPAPSETASAEPEAPKAPVEPPIEPGLDFQKFTSIFGSVPTVRGHVAFDNSEIWARVLAARMYARSPQILNNDTHAIELLGQMATQPEYVQVLGPLADRQPRQMSVFERRDIAERIRNQIKGGLDQRRQTGPILVYNSVQLRLGDYDFNSQSFPLSNIEGVRNHRGVGWKNATVQNAFSNVVLPSRLGATQDQARQLDAYLRSRNDNTLYFAIFAEIDPVMPRSLSDHSNQSLWASNTKVTQVALFADRGLSQVLYDFTGELAAEQQKADIAAAALTQRLSTAEDAIRTIDKINGGAAATTAVADIFARTNYGQSNETPEVRRETALAGIRAASDAPMLRLAGNIRFGSYDPIRKMLPVTSFGVQGLRFTSFQGNMGVQITYVPQLTEIPMDQATASRVIQASQNSQVEFRLNAELMQGSHRTQGAEYLQVNAIVRPEEIQLFSNNNRYNRAPRQMLLDLKLPETTSTVPSLMDAR
ncbi:MAG: hypothetical protein AAGO57_04065, partial [Pseudomonadota bacterium]